MTIECFLEIKILYERMEGEHKCKENLGRVEKSLMERVDEASKALFIDVKFIHTFILCIYLER